MIDRYENPRIAEICSKASKAHRWQLVELAVILAKVRLGRIDHEVHNKIQKIWLTNPLDLNKWEEIEKKTDHDLAAFISERKSYLPAELARFVHADNMTSYDTEEPAFAIMLLECMMVVTELIDKLDEALSDLALKYRYTIMNGRTHGQEAELQSFGKRCLTWLKPIRQARESLEFAIDTRLNYTKLSGAIGTYSGIDPDLERAALRILGLDPYVGATQIVPRTHYTPLASGLNELMNGIANIALDIRLGARSGLPIYREPFMTTQVGSSAMPQKKNTIKAENTAGMKSMSSGYLNMLDQVAVTWEERAIEQSCVERVAWPDLFHVVTYSLKTVTVVLKGLQVYPDNMLQEIVQSRGCYAASLVKDFLAEHLVPQGLAAEDVYRITQLACFNVFEPSTQRLEIRNTIVRSFEQSKSMLQKAAALEPEKIVSIQELIPMGSLRVTPELAATEEQVQNWNSALLKMFEDWQLHPAWNELFNPEHLLRNEQYIFQEILGK